MYTPRLNKYCLLLFLREGTVCCQPQLVSEYLYKEAMSKTLDSHIQFSKNKLYHGDVSQSYSGADAAASLNAAGQKYEARVLPLACTPVCRGAAAIVMT